MQKVIALNESGWVRRGCVQGAEALGSLKLSGCPVVLPPFLYRLYRKISLESNTENGVF